MTPGQIGYQAYALSTGGKTFDDRVMPCWEDLPERIQAAWEAAAAAIRLGCSCPCHRPDEPAHGGCEACHRKDHRDAARLLLGPKGCTCPTTVNELTECAVCKGMRSRAQAKL
jgi:hypothetical protein